MHDNGNVSKVCNDVHVNVIGCVFCDVIGQYAVLNVEVRVELSFSLCNVFCWQLSFLSQDFKNKFLCKGHGYSRRT